MNKDNTQDLSRKNTEIRDDLHLMCAEGSEDFKMTEAQVMKHLFENGFIASEIDIWLDKSQNVWRWVCDIAPIPQQHPKDKPGKESVSELETKQGNEYPEAFKIKYMRNNEILKAFDKKEYAHLPMDKWIKKFCGPMIGG
jgi:hypothetical protein